MGLYSPRDARTQNSSRRACRGPFTPCATETEPQVSWTIWAPWACMIAAVTWSSCATPRSRMTGCGGSRPLTGRRSGAASSRMGFAFASVRRSGSRARSAAAAGAHSAATRTVCFARGRKPPEATTRCAIPCSNLRTSQTLALTSKPSGSFPPFQRSAPRTFLPQRLSRAVWRRWTSGSRARTRQVPAGTAARPCTGGSWAPTGHTSPNCKRGAWCTSLWCGRPSGVRTPRRRSSWRRSPSKRRGDEASATTGWCCAAPAPPSV